MLNGRWARYAVERYMLLKRWRKLATIIAKACEDVLGKDCQGVYVVGGAAENRLTVLSDIDVVVIVDKMVFKNVDTIIAIKRRAEQLGLPVEAPIDLKILTREELRKLVEKGIYKRMESIREPNTIKSD
jgi:predicted nucleotidyltransferase